ASLWNTMLFTVISVALELVLGLGIAVLINQQFRGRGLVRAAVLIPWAIPTVVSALMWKFLYDGQNGIVAHLLEKVSLIPNMGWLLTTKFGAMLSVILSDVWKTTPFMALLLFAGLQTIPQSLYEAAEVDGASRVQQFFKITLPLLKSSILVALLFRTLDAVRVFDLVYVLTGGGPANSTETISIYAYKTMFAQMNFGAGSALSVIVFLCVALISIGYIKILGAGLLGDAPQKK
ncbi:MAG: carbohydrate ABC transporter permease, partial [Tumebacillaceae bacterium]